MTGLIDYHLHTELCRHATGPTSGYVERALALGLSEMGFSEHLPLYHLPREQRDPEIALVEEELPDYVALVDRLRRQYPQIPIRLGIEADYIPGREADLDRMLAGQPWDYVIGSVHFIGDWVHDNPALQHRFAEWDIDELYETYFGLVERAAASGRFDIMAHLDLVKKFGHRPRRDPTPLYARVARALAEAGVCYELSTAGLRKPVGEMYPDPRLMRRLHAAHVPITLGSDAHHPGEVGADFDRALALLREVGYREVCVFRNRRREARRLP